ncbi:hypothetical protein, partial [Bacillus sp. S74]|uniref:hypothetical protein n=1 Tax=Bacillus sp. S74 TaxID=1317225 RepID=UPI001F1892E0
IKILPIIKINKILLFSDKIFLPQKKCTFLCFEDYSKYYLDSKITILLRNLKNSNQYILAVKKNIQSKINGYLSA